MKEDKELKLAIVLLAGLLIAWSIFIPVFEGPDESGHYCHAEYITRNRRLPNFNIRDGCYLAYPPGYYVLLTPIIAFNEDAYFSDEQIQPNSKYASNRKDKDVFSKYIHPITELFFQWNPLLRTVHILRLISIAFGLGMIFLTVKAARLVTKYRYLPFSSIVLFFNPMFLHTFSLITNVTLVSFLATVFIYLHLKQEAEGSSRKLAFFGGIVLGFGVITKINMLSHMIGYVFTLLSSKWKSKEKLNHFAMMNLGFFFSAGWYICRTIKLYGEPFEINIASSFRGGSMTRMQEMGLVNYWSSFPDTLFRTFWSGYGLNKVWLPEVVILWLLIMTCFILLGFFSQYRKLPRLIKVSFYYVMAVLLGHALINIRTEAFHAKDTFIAYLPLSLILSIGAKKFISEREKGDFLTRRRFLIIFGLTLVFYAKFEIVRLIKLALTVIGLTGSFAMESILLSIIFLQLIGKGVIVWGLMQIMKYSVKVLQGDKAREGVMAALTILNLLVLSWASYNFYYEFL